MRFSSSFISQLRSPRAVWYQKNVAACVLPTTALVLGQGGRHFHFGSNDYEKTFRQLPKPNIETIRNSSRVYLKSFDPQLWYNDPVS